MWFWIITFALGGLYYLIKEHGKHKDRKDTPITRRPQAEMHDAPAFNDPRKMSKDEYMRFRGYDPDDPQDRMAAKDDQKPEDSVFDTPICIWRGKHNATIEYDGGTLNQPRNVDLIELVLDGAADALVFTAFCHTRNEKRHFIASKIRNISINGSSGDIISFCRDVLHLPVRGQIADDRIMIFADSIGGIPFNPSKHFNSEECAKMARKLRKARK